MIDLTRDDHRIILPFAHVTFHKDGTAAKAREAWTHVTISSGNVMSAQFVFERAHLGGVEMVLRLMEDAFENGRQARAAEIRDALGIVT